MITIRATFDGKVFIPEFPVHLPKDRVVNLHVEGDEESQNFQPETLFKRLSELPRIPQEDLDELERHIREGQVPADFRGIFDE